MPASRAAPSRHPPTTDAVDAAAKAVAQDAIVSGLDAVAASAVRRARATVTTSEGTSSPDRTRWADHSVRAPITHSTAAPTRPITTRTGEIATSEAAPSMPSPPYAVSTAAAPAPTASPGANPYRRVVRMHRSDTGPTWAATSAPRPRPVRRAVSTPPFDQARWQNAPGFPAAGPGPAPRTGPGPGAPGAPVARPPCARPTPRLRH